MLCLSLEVNLLWVICRRYKAILDGTRELHNNIKRMTGYKHVMLLTTLRTDDGLKISNFLKGIERPIQSRDFEAVYITQHLFTSSL